MRVSIITVTAHPLRLTGVRHLPLALRGGFTTLHRTEKAPLEVSRGAVCALRRLRGFEATFNDAVQKHASGRGGGRVHPAQM